MTPTPPPLTLARTRGELAAALAADTPAAAASRAVVMTTKLKEFLKKT